MAEVKLVGSRYIVWTSTDGNHMYREATVEEVMKALKLHSLTLASDVLPVNQDDKNNCAPEKEA